MATVLLGPGGGFLLVFQLWMAVTASGSAEQIAVSSLIAYDVYRPYINKKATGKQIIFVSRMIVLVYGVLSGVLAIVLLKIGLSLGWVYLVGSNCTAVQAVRVRTFPDDQVTHCCSQAMPNVCCNLAGIWCFTAVACYVMCSSWVLWLDLPCPLSPSASLGRRFLLLVPSVELLQVS